MSLRDIADYLGLTIETVCRVLSAFRREGIIAIPTPQRIELRDRRALEGVGDAPSLTERPTRPLRGGLEY